ncbi:MAG TPA: hypothetical protein VGQ69_12160 [Gemmatimonadales bacterium]|nr:hypothetical protein [Gemmatimonadales bacterium]
MTQDRRRMTVKLVPLQSPEAGDGTVGGTIAERLTLVDELSRRMWELTKRPLPTYTRSAIPFRLSSLADQ